MSEGPFQLNYSILAVPRFPVPLQAMLEQISLFSSSGFFICFLFYFFIYLFKRLERELTFQEYLGFFCIYYLYHVCIKYTCTFYTQLL